MHDVLRETPIYQEILKEGREEGREEGIEIGRGKGIEIGREEGIEIGRGKGIEIGELKGLNRAAVKIVIQRFPTLVRLARKQVALIEDADVLLDVIGKLTTAQSVEEAKQHLLALDENEE